MNDDLTPSGERAVRLAIEVAALRAKIARVEALADEWAAMQERNRAQLITRFQHQPRAMLETFEPVSDLRAALEGS